MIELVKEIAMKAIAKRDSRDPEQAIEQEIKILKNQAKPSVGTSSQRS